jgi:hypothetical protein
MFRIMFALALVACSSAALASPPCVEPVCDPKKAGGSALCAYNADWIIEGQIYAIADEHGSMCATNMGCSAIWRGGYVTLTKQSIAITKSTVSTALSGAFKPLSPFGPIRIDAGSHCWAGTTRLEPSMIGKRVRLYGINDNNLLRLSNFVRVGYFAFEIIE